MNRKPKAQDIVCCKCKRLATPVRLIYCKNCATVALRTGELQKLPVAPMPPNLTGDQEEILNGLLLGDGCLYRNTVNCKPHLSVIRSQTDRDYLVENYNVFKDFCKHDVVHGSVFDKRTQKTNYFSKFVTRSCPAFVQHYERWYPGEIKHVPLSLKLTPLMMAIWFADDGHFKTSCAEWRFSLQLSLDGFCLKEVEFLKNQLENLCHETFFISGESSKKSLRLCAADSGSRTFAKIIDEFLPRSMDRKAVWRNQNARFYQNQPICFGLAGGTQRQEELNRIKAFVDEGKTALQIAETLGISRSCVLKRVKRYGILTGKGFYLAGAKIGRPKKVLTDIVA